MENQKSKKGLIAFLIVIILLLITALGLLLGGVIKNPFIKETASTDKTTKTTKSSDSTKTAGDKKESADYFIDVDKIVKDEFGTFDLGELTIDGKQYKVKYELIEDAANNNFAHNLYFNDKKVAEDDIHYLHYIAIMDGKYLVFNNSGTAIGGIVTLYDSNFNKVDEIGDSHGFSSRSEDGDIVRGSFEQKDQIIDSNTLIVYKCIDNPDSPYDQTLKEKMISFKDGKYTEKELLTVENVYCKQLK